MNVMTGFGSVPAPKHRASEFLAYERECRTALAPLLANLIDMAESAGWSRQAAASTLMFLAAQHVSAAQDLGNAGRSAIDPSPQGRVTWTGQAAADRMTVPS